MLKPTIFQQMDIENTKWISQQVESNATSPSLERSVSLETIPAVTQGSDHVADPDTDDDEDQEQAMSDVQKSIAVGRARRNPHKLNWLNY